MTSGQNHRSTSPLPRSIQPADGTLNDGEKFSGDIRPEITVEDDIDPSPLWSATLDGIPFESGTLVTGEGSHTIEAQASDSAGNEASAIVSFTIDKTPPEVTVTLEGTTPDGVFYSTEVIPGLAVSDLTATTITATLDDGEYIFGPLVEGQYHRVGPSVVAEGSHELVVTVTDDVEWETTSTTLFTIDRTNPDLSILANDAALIDEKYFSKDVTLAAHAEDDSPLDVILVVDGAQVDPAGTLFTTEKSYTVSAKATDAAGWTTEVGPYTFTVDKTAPHATLLVNNQPLPDDGHVFSGGVSFHIDTAEAGAIKILTLDGVEYSEHDLIESEGPHTIEGSVTDVAGNMLPLPRFSFRIDKTKPTVNVTVDGAPLSSDALFGTAITATVTVTDETLATVEIHDGDKPLGETEAEGATTLTIDVPFEEGEHSLIVTAIDRAGWTADFTPIDFIVDQSPPEVTITHDGNPLKDGSSWNETIIPEADVVRSHRLD